jgi:stage III sporulation protein AF
MLYRSIIEDAAAAYIQDKAEEMGLSCQVAVSADYDEEGELYLRSVSVSGSWTEEQERQLSQMIEEDLGVAAQAQQLERAVP